MLKKTNNIEIYHKKLNAVLNKVRKLKVIKVSIINDFCIGAGFIFAMYTDICIVNDNCVFSVPASKLNIKLELIIVSIYKISIHSSHFRMVCNWFL